VDVELFKRRVVHPQALYYGELDLHSVHTHGEAFVIPFHRDSA
jgi:hypothetical protein